MRRKREIPRLLGQQCKIVYMPRNHDQVVSGVAGSGKTLEAIYRAIWLSKMRKSSKPEVLVLTINTRVNEVIAHTLRNYNIRVSTIYSFFQSLISECLPKKSKFQNDVGNRRANDINHKFYPKIFSLLNTEDKITASTNSSIVQVAINKAKNKLGNKWDSIWPHTNPEQLFKLVNGELHWMQDYEISYNPYDKRGYDYYTNTNTTRIGRNSFRITQLQREAIYCIYYYYYNLRLNKNKLFNFHDIYRLVKYMDIKPKFKYKYIIIDEYQDLSPVILRAITQNIREDNESYISLFGDASQNIFGNRISWKSFGIHLLKHHPFKYNYRNSKEITIFASNILKHAKYLKNKINNNVSLVFGKNPTTPIIPSRSTQVPKVVQIDEFSIKHVQKIVNKSIDGGNTILVICNYYPELKKLKNIIKPLFNQLVTKGYNKLLKEYSNISKESAKRISKRRALNKVSVAPISKVKGLEYDNVIIYGIDSKFLNTMNQDQQRIFFTRLYTSVTRAKNKLLMFCHHPECINLIRRFIYPNPEDYHIHQFIRKHGIKYLCHFTKSSNLPFILGYDNTKNGIKSTSQLHNQNYATIIDKQRDDHNQDYVCCSISNINIPFYRSRKFYKDRKDQYRDWVIILINPDVINHTSKFCPVNAATNNGEFIHSGLKTFKDLFVNAIKMPNGRVIKRHSTMHNNEPTCIQAEVLIKNKIPKNMIEGIAFPNSMKSVETERMHSWLKRNDFHKYSTLMKPWHEFCRQEDYPSQVHQLNNKFNE